VLRCPLSVVPAGVPMGHESDKGEFMNHSCAPNCRESRLRGLRDLQPRCLRTPLASDRLAASRGRTLCAADSCRYGALLILLLVISLPSSRHRTVAPFYSFPHILFTRVAVFQGDELCIAGRDIEVDEEVTYDYATSETPESTHMPFHCRCGTALCRGDITGEDCIKPAIRELYKGHFTTLAMAYQAEHDAKASHVPAGAGAACAPETAVAATA